MAGSYLCVGGPNDGQWMTLLYGHSAIVYHDGERHLYHIAAIAGDSRGFEILIPAGMSGDQMIEQLIHGYKSVIPFEHEGIRKAAIG